MLWFEIPYLTNILDNFKWENTVSEYNEIEMIELNFSEKEYDEVVNSIVSLMDNYIINNPLEFSNYKFDLELKDYVLNNILLALDPLDCDKDELENYLDNTYDEIYDIYFNNYHIKRSYDNTFILKKPDLMKMQENINYLKNKPQPEQQTNEWYKFRHNLLTASSIWKVFKSQATINQLICDKCIPINLEKYNSINTESTLHHGHKYEPLSVLYYEKVYNTKIEDFGCIQHDNYECIGASPDGINVDINSDLYGRMLEIKNIVNRDITGIPKEEYWIQMQVQMETCNLDECDFLETQFVEYENEDCFNLDGTFEKNQENKLKGIIMYFINNGKPLYEYMPLGYNKKQYEIWYEKTMEKNKNLTWIKNIYWKLEKVSCVLVLRNKFWFENSKKKIQDVWNIIVKEKVSGCEHRLPVKKVKVRKLSIDLTNEEDIPNGKCMINVSEVRDTNSNTIKKIKIKENSEKNNKKNNEENNQENNQENSEKMIFTIDT